MGLPTLVLLNMSDLMTSRGGEIDPLALARELGAPVAMISATKGAGFDAIGRFLCRLSEPAEARSSSRCSFRYCRMPPPATNGLPR
jgi:ferrous iron transport protein B